MSPASDKLRSIQGPKRSFGPPVDSPSHGPPAEVPPSVRTRPRGFSNQLRERPPDLSFLHNSNRIVIASFFLPVTVDFVGAPVDTAEPAPPRRRPKGNSDAQDNFATAFSPASSLLGFQEPVSSSTLPSAYRDVPRRKPSSVDVPIQSATDFTIVPATMGNIGLRNAVHSIPQLRAAGKCVWVGALSGVSTELASLATQEAIRSRLLAEADSVPVFLSDDVYHGAYEVFAKSVLWKLLHYQVNDVPRGQAFDQAAWEAYVNVNRMFASVLAETYEPGDVLWVNDYHLMLLPSMLRQLLPQASIGYYQHVPFPSSEIFRCLHVRKQILEGMMGADLIGFQQYSYLRHFLITVSRILSLDTSPRGIQLPETVVSVGIFQMGIDVAALNDRRRNPTVEEYAKKLLKRHAGRQLIVGRDKLDTTKGFVQKLLSYETFLLKYPEFIGKVTLIQVAIPTNLEDELAADVGDLVARINAQFGTLDWFPVVYLQKDLPFEHYLGLLAAADACLITSLRDGQNLTSHEFVVMQDAKKSPLILSEFAGTYSCFGAALRVNPHDFDMIADRIHEALTMTRDEKESRWEELYHNVLNSGAVTFTSGFLSELDRTHTDAQARYRTNIPHLEVSTFVQAWESAKGLRLLFIDQDGTLFPSRFLQPVAPKSDGTASGLAPTAAAPPTEFSPANLAALLRDLTESDPRNRFFLMSGRPRDRLTEGGPDNMLDGVGASAENGCFYRFPGEEWEALFEPDSLTWKKPVLDIINYYNDRTAGTHVEIRESSIVWNFANAEPVFGQRQAAECANQISGNVAVNYPIHCLIKRGRLEVLPTHCNKGAVVKRVLERYPMADFALIMGDDVADEDMFEVAENFAAASVVGAGAGASDRGRRSSTAASSVLSDYGDDRWSASGSPMLDGTNGSPGNATFMGRSGPPPMRLGEAMADPAPLVRRATTYARLLPTTFMTVTTGAKSTKARYFCAGTNEIWELLRSAVRLDRSEGGGDVA